MCSLGAAPPLTLKVHSLYCLKNHRLVRQRRRAIRISRVGGVGAGREGRLGEGDRRD